MTPLLLLWATILVLQIVRNNLSWLMQASLEFRTLASIGSYVAVASVTTTVIAVTLAGTTGALIAMLASEGLLVCLLFWHMSRKFHHILLSFGTSQV
jgi:hypothetical protein